MFGKMGIGEGRGGCWKTSSSISFHFLIRVVIFAREKKNSRHFNVTSNASLDFGISSQSRFLSLW